MVTVDTANQTRLRDSFSDSTEEIREELSVGKATAADGHFTKWAYFCSRVALDPLLVAYKDSVPIPMDLIRTTGHETLHPTAMQYYP